MLRRHELAAGLITDIGGVEKRSIATGEEEGEGARDEYYRGIRDSSFFFDMLFMRIVLVAHERETDWSLISITQQ